MRIAIQAADLDASRIDGTRVYIHNLLKYFGRLDKSSEFLLYHKGQFNPELIPADFPNYKIIQKGCRFLWTQTRFSCELWKDNPSVLWMPMHNIPLFTRKNLKKVVTIHDLAFFYFPEMFPARELIQIKLLTKMAVERADRIIAISESTKRDILKFYPKVKENKIKVIYHGFDAELFSAKRNLEKEEETKKRYGIFGTYILYTGGIQPRKNLETLVHAFEILKSEKHESNLHLVLAGGTAWLSGGILEQVRKSPFSKDIILTGKVPFADLAELYRGASLYVYPSLYDGFGITPLEAFASRVPVVCANNSSLPEVCADAALYFDAQNEKQLASQMEKILASADIKKDLIEKGLNQLKKFSWEKCARETLECFKEV